MKVEVIAQLYDVFQTIVAAVAPPPSLNFATPGSARRERPKFRPAEYGKTGHCANCFTTEVHERGGCQQANIFPFQRDA